MRDAAAKSSRNSKASLVLSVMALAVAVGGIGGPALARAIAPNADKVDGLHAVKSSANSSVRAGKLVGTDARGRLPSSAINPRAAFPSTVPAGVTVRGFWGIDDQDPGNTGTEWGAPISFPAAMPGVLDVEVLDTGESSDNCPGSAERPQADPGWLCVYTAVRGGVGEAMSTPQTSSRLGTIVWAPNDAGPYVFITGTWAATAPR